MQQSKWKKVRDGILGTIFIFTFVIPVIPVAGVDAWQHFHPNNSSTDDSSSATSYSSDSSSDNSPSDSTATDDSYTSKDSNAYDLDNSYDDNNDTTTNDSSDFYVPTPDYNNATYNGYTNVDGDYIPSPNYSGNTIGGYSPTYTCVDGTYSYAQHSQGACSHHGGIGY